MAEDEHLSDELTIDFRGRVFDFREHDHAFADFFPSDAFQGERGGLSGGADGDGDAFAFDAADGGCGELPKGVWADKDCVSGMDDSGFYDAGDDCADKGDGEGVIDVEFKGSGGIVVAVMGEHVEKHSHQIKGLAGNIADLENGADALGDELRGGDDGFVAVIDKHWDFARPRGLQDAG